MDSSKFSDNSKNLGDKKKPSRKPFIGERDLGTAAEPSSGGTQGQRAVRELASLTLDPQRPESISRADMQRIIDRSQESRSSVNDAPTGWQGSPRETLEKLLRKVAEQDFSQCNDKQELKKQIYNLYGRDDRQQGFSNTIDDASYKESILKIELPEGVKHGSTKGYIHFINDTRTKIEGWTRRRFSLNIHPDHIVQVTKKIVEEMATLPYVIDIKTASTTSEAIQKADNIIVFFNDQGNSIDDLKSRLEPYLQFTRLSHPPMMEPINDKTESQGIAFADQSQGGSWGHTRAKAIAKAIWKFKQMGMIPFEKLLPEVEKQFKLADINHEKPQWNL